MKIRRITLEDYREVCSWWQEQGKAILAWELLPTLGFLAEENGKSLAVAWLYCSDSSTGFVGWMTVNNYANKRSVAKAIKAIEYAVCESAKATGLKMILQFSGGGGFSRLLLKSGWRDSMVKHDLLLKEI